MADKRQKILDRIRHLRNRTVAKGCTEVEAIAAAEKVAALLAENDLTLDEVEVRATPFAREDSSVEGDIGERIWKVADAIAGLTDTRCWTNPSGVTPVRITFFGLQHEAAIATYLLAVCSRAMRDELDRVGRGWVLFRPNVQRRHRNAFLDGMADSLSTRIRSLKPPQLSGSGLVVLKNSLIDAELARLNMRVQDLRGRRANDLDLYYGHGRAAGEQVALDPGLRPPERTVGLIGTEAR